MSAIGKRMGNIFYGWWIVGAGIVLCMFGYGGWFYSFGTLFNPISSEFGWSRATTSLAFSLSRLEGGIEGLVTGPLVDKFGPRFLVRVGFTMAAIGFFLMYKINNLWMFILTYSLLLSLGMNAGLYTPLQTTVAKWFNQKRGMALGLLTTGAAVGGFILTPFTAWLITEYTWRTAVLVLGGMALVLGWSMSFILRPKGPEAYGLTMDGIAAEQLALQSQAKKETHSADYGLTLKQALKTRAFWLMVVAFTCSHTAVSAIVVHEIPLIEDMGISKVAAATALGMMTLMSAPGRLCGGWLADKWNIKYLYSISSIAQAGSLYIFANATNMTWVWVFVVAYGLSYGFRIPLEPSMRAQFFGQKAFGAIMGYMNAFAVLGSFAGPYFAGWVYDTFGSYARAFIVFAAMMIITAVVVLFLKSPLQHSEKAVTPAH